MCVYIRYKSAAYTANKRQKYCGMNLSNGNILFGKPARKT